MPLIYDCFIFNKELDLLELRLEFLYDYVEKFVLVESSQTLSKEEKPLFFAENIERFEKYLDKIIYIECPKKEFDSAWDYEYFQRDFIKQGLKNCKSDDIILISDVDEIPNIPDIINSFDLTQTYLIEIAVSYYFFNLQSHYKFAFNLWGPYAKIKDINLGNRETYSGITTNIIRNNKNFIAGWHFSFLFGTDIDMYINKIKSFSHQEYNTDYYLNRKRILLSVLGGVDIFERKSVQFFAVPLEKAVTKLLLEKINKLNLDKTFNYKKYFLLKSLCHPIGLKYFFQLKMFPKIKRKIKLVFK